MIEGWKKRKLGDVVKKNVKSIGKKYPYEVIQYLDTGSITENNIEDIQKFHIENAPSRAKRKISKGDIIYSTVRPNQKHYGYISEEPEKNLVVSTGFAVLTTNPKQASSKFLYYFLTEAEIVEKLHIVADASMSTYPSLKPKDITNLDIQLPPLPEQKAIAEVLSSLDDKIDLLHRQNETLENLAQTIFRQTFIENPQDDWEEKPLDQIADYLNGLACQKYPPKNHIDKLPVLKIKELRSGISESSDYASTNIPKQYFVNNGDIVFSWSGSLLVKIWGGEICILNQHLFKITSESFPKWFYYLWTKHHLEKFVSIAEGKATTMGHIKRSDLSSSMVLIPDTKAAKSLNASIDPMIEKIIINNKQINLLSTQRDFLLPKLISGEVRVRDY